jgi:hypothetical protein
LPTKKKSDSDVAVATAPEALKYTNSRGEEVSVRMADIPDFADTDTFASSNMLWGDDVTAYCLAQHENMFDDEGRPSITGKNFVALDARWLKNRGKNERYGNYFSILGLIPETGETISVLSRGTVVNGTFELLTGIDLKTGNRTERKSELPAKIRIVFNPDAGDFDGYYEVRPWAVAPSNGDSPDGE